MVEPKKSTSVTCQICGKTFDAHEVMSGELVRSPVAVLIQEAHPQWTADGFVCLADLNRFRTLYVQKVLETEKGELSSLEEEVIRSLHEHELVAADINTEFEKELTFGHRLSDRLAEFGGSWTFITLFALILLTWIAINSASLLLRPFDPFPYILLNLVLSCLAAIQAPIIMMSQNRQEAKDRLRAENDYRINLKAELEVRHLNAKMDLLLMHQWQRLLEIQQIQTDLMEELVQKETSSGKE